MSPLGKQQSHLHTGNTAADNGNLFGCFCLLQSVFLLLEGHRIQRAMALGSGILQVHDGTGVLIITYGQTGVMTGDAGTDLIFPALFQLGQVFTVAQQLPGDAHSIDLAGLDGAFSRVGLHFAGDNNGDIHKLRNVLCLAEVAVQRHVYRRMGPIPAVVGAVVAVQCVIARVLEILRGLLALFHIPADFRKFFTGDSAHFEIDDLGGNGVAQHDGIILTALPLDGLYHLYSEAIAVFKAAAVFIGPVVIILQGELVHQIALVDRMDLNTVYTDVLAQLGGLGIALNIVLNLLDGKSPGRKLGCPGQRQTVVRRDHHLIKMQQRIRQFFQPGLLGDVNKLGHDGIIPTRKAGTQLKEDFGTVFMNLIDQRLRLPEGLGILVQPFAHHHGIHRNHSGNEQAHFILGPLNVVVPCLFVIMGTVHVLNNVGSLHCRDNDAVSDLAVTDFEGGKQSFVFCHINLLSFQRGCTFLFYGIFSPFAIIIFS